MTANERLDKLCHKRIAKSAEPSHSRQMEMCFGRNGDASTALRAVEQQNCETDNGECKNRAQEVRRGKHCGESIDMRRAQKRVLH